MKEDVCYLDLVADLSGYSNILGYDFECGHMKNQEFKVAGYSPKNKFKVIPLKFIHKEKEIKYHYDIAFWEFNLLKDDTEYYEDFLDRIYKTLKRLRDDK